MYRLRVFPSQGEDFEVPLADESILIGRVSESDLVVQDRFLSRQHARLFRKGNHIWIEDLGSSNGTWLNDRRVEQPTEIHPGDELRLSTSYITLLSDGIETPTPRKDPVTEHNTRYRRASDLIDSDSATDLAGSAPRGASRRQTDRFQLLNSIHHSLSGTLQPDQLLEMILDRCYEALLPDHAAIFLKRDSGEYYLAAERSSGGPGIDHLYSKTLLHEVADNGMAALVTDARTDHRFDEADSVLGSGVQSLVAAPLLSPEDSLGMIALASSLEQSLFVEEDRDLLASIASIAALRIHIIKLAQQAAEEAAERRRFEAELELAHAIQTAVLPSELPRIEGYDLTGSTIPSRWVSGDYYQAVERLGGKETVLMVADVCGKGICASLTTLSLEALAAGPIEIGQPPAELCTRVNRRLHSRTLPNRFATAFVVVLEPNGRILRYASAGHPGLLVGSKGNLLKLGSTGPPLGAFPDIEYGESTALLESGDTLALFTDGIIEATNPQDEEFGTERLSEVLISNREADLEVLAGAVETALEEFAEGVPYADDRTLVLLRKH
ncbi:MAG: SpoIIE family protein phosphatase [Nitrospirae bacterium]|nr:SpoIIE family protein phosphatase [Nitrospirota bacterium]